jgi:hypothetical protein
MAIGKFYRPHPSALSGADITHFRRGAVRALPSGAPVTAAALLLQPVRPAPLPPSAAPRKISGLDKGTGEAKGGDSRVPSEFTPDLGDEGDDNDPPKPRRVGDGKSNNGPGKVGVKNDVVPSEDSRLPGFVMLACAFKVFYSPFHPPPPLHLPW